MTAQKVLRISSLFSMVMILSVALTGCEDPDARLRAKRALEQQVKLEERIGILERDLKTTRQEITQLRGTLTHKMDNWKAEIDSKISQNHSHLLDQLNTQLEETRKSITNTTTEMESRLNQKIESRLNIGVAGQLRDLDQKWNKKLDDNKNLMHNQLKELYPYAYQPRRLDPAQPPEIPQ